MNPWVKWFLIVFLSPLALAAQSKEETMRFIIDELHSLELRTFTVREAFFSANGDTFHYRWVGAGAPERGIVIPLKNVDIYAVEYHHVKGVNSFNLMVRCRGVDRTISVNGLPFNGTRELVRGIENRKQALALERAFTRLTTLTTGRTYLFQDP